MCSTLLLLLTLKSRSWVSGLFFFFLVCTQLLLFPCSFFIFCGSRKCSSKYKHCSQGSQVLVCLTVTTHVQQWKEEINSTTFGMTLYNSCLKGLVQCVYTSSFQIHVIVSIVAGPLCAVWAIIMVKLSKNGAKQRLQLLFLGVSLPFPEALVFSWFAWSTLGMNNYMVICIWKQSLNRNYLEGVCSGWDKKSDMVQTSTCLMTQGSYFTHASVAE